jgi:hypothetical protein
MKLGDGEKKGGKGMRERGRRQTGGVEGKKNRGDRREEGEGEGGRVFGC